MDDHDDDDVRCFGLTEDGLSALASSITDDACRVRINPRLDAAAALLWSRGLILLDPGRAQPAQLFYLASLHAFLRRAAAPGEEVRAPSKSLLAQAHRELRARYPGLTVPPRAKQLTGDLRWSPDSAPLQPARNDASAIADAGSFELLDFGTDSLQVTWEHLLAAVEQGEVPAKFLQGFDDVPYVEVPLELPADQHVAGMQAHFAKDVCEMRDELEQFKRCFQQRNSGDLSEAVPLHHRERGEEIDPEMLHDAYVAGRTGEQAAVFFEEPEPPIEEFDPARALTIYAFDLNMLKTEAPNDVDESDEDRGGKFWRRGRRRRDRRANTDLLRLPVGSILLVGQAMRELGVPFEIHGYQDVRVELGGQTWLIHVKVPVLRDGESWEEQGFARLGRLVTMPVQLPGEKMSFSPLQVRDSLARIDALKAKRQARWTFYTHMSAMPRSATAMRIRDYDERCARSLHEQFEGRFASEDDRFQGLFYFDPDVVTALPDKTDLKKSARQWSLTGLMG